MKELLQLQQIDLNIEKLKEREKAIPRQKDRFKQQRERLADELAASEKKLKDLQLEQRQAEGDIEQSNQQIAKYNTQLLSVKKNEEYQALLHEIENTKKKIGLREERIIGIMMELDEAKVSLQEDKKRIEAELKAIDAQCKEVDAELAEATRERQALEANVTPLAGAIDPQLLTKYNRIRRAKGGGLAIAPMLNEACGGCHMKLRAQTINEILGGGIHSCGHCNVLLYDPDRFADESAVAPA